MSMRNFFCCFPRGILLIKAGPVLVFGNGLVDGEVHLPALADLAARNLPTSVAKRGEGLVFRVIDEDIPVSQIENLGTAVFSGCIPKGVPELPANLKSGERLASARCHRQQDAFLALE
jgi:hypothetical protein